MSKTSPCRESGLACGSIRPFHSPDLFWLILGWCCIFHGAPQTILELTDALILVWEEIPPGDSVDPSGVCPDAVLRTNWHVEAVHTMESHQFTGAGDLVFSALNLSQSRPQRVNDFSLHHFIHYDQGCVI